MRPRIALLALLCILGCDDGDIIIEDETPDVVTIVEHVWHTTLETIVLEDNTPDVVYEFYSDAADFPALVWEDQGGEPPMPKKFSDLVVATSLQDADILAILQGGTSKQLTAELLKRFLALDPRYGFILSEDFCGTDDSNEWYLQVVSGAGAQVITRGDITGMQGALQPATGTTATGRACQWSGARMKPTLGDLDFDLGIQVPTLSDGTDRFTVYVGFGDSSGAGDMSNGVYFRYSDNLSSGNWERCTASGATRTQQDTGIAVTTSNTHLGVRINAGGTSVEFLIDGVSAGTITTNIPTASQPFGQLVKIEKALGTASRVVNLDYFQTRFLASAAR